MDPALDTALHNSKLRGWLIELEAIEVRHVTQSEQPKSVLSYCQVTPESSKVLVSREYDMGSTRTDNSESMLELQRETERPWAENAMIVEFAEFQYGLSFSSTLPPLWIHQVLCSALHVFLMLKSMTERTRNGFLLPMHTQMTLP